MAIEQYLALITVADVLMITSLREGMNLTSHEFVYCQDGSLSDKRYGSLILSEFTGSASVFRDHALLVNPWDYHQCAGAIHTALTQDKKMRKGVWEELQRVVVRNSSANWVNSFKETLRRVWSEQSSRGITAVPRLSVPRLIERYRQTKRRLMLFDYEGTLAPWGSSRSTILITPHRAITTLSDLTDDPANLVYLLSSRTPEEMEHLFRHVSNLGLIAENGCFARKLHSDQWSHLADKERATAWKKSVGPVLAYFKDRIEGSWIEERNCSILFHYGSAEDRRVAARLAAECADHINDACKNQGVHVIPVEGALVVKAASTDKDSAVKLVWKWCLEDLDKKGQDAAKPDFVLVVSGNREDEPVFRWANKLQDAKAVNHVMTITLGSRSTEAMTTLTRGVSGTFLSLLSRCSVY
jgi:trehalose 6-phosphate synthase/phosphatase